MTSVSLPYLLMNSFILKKSRKKVMQSIPTPIKSGQKVQTYFCLNFIAKAKA